MTREIEAKETIYNGIKYRSITEARWAIFFGELELKVKYEEERITLIDGQKYLPDFYIPEFDCYFEVKANNDDIVIDEASKALTLARMGKKVLLAKGAPSPKTPNILYFNNIDEHYSSFKTNPELLNITQILKEPAYLGRIMEDRRDRKIYWCSTEQPRTGEFTFISILGGHGMITEHERFPVIHDNVEHAYQKALSYTFFEEAENT